MLWQNGRKFTCGYATYRGQAPGAREPTDKIFVPIEFQGIPDNGLLAQVDTGAAYSMLDVGIAEALDVLNGDGELTTISTRFGPITGRLERISVSLLAEEGESLDFEATFLVSRDWTVRTFIGYTGFLDRIRIALDPLVNLFYFGDCER
jgi:hypothetical protein